MTRTIVAIGGGSMIEGATRSIDEHIVKLSGKKNPRALFIPTASSDDPLYWENFQKVYGDKLGCRPEVLFLLKRKVSKKEIHDKIERADIIYIGGGNTLKMMRRWRLLGVDVLLKKAWNSGTIMAGTSAGAICWFKFGHSDSMFYYHPEKWEHIRVKGLDLVNTTFCPHYLKEKRDAHFRKMISKKGGVGIACDDCSAIEIRNTDSYKILSSKKDAHAFKVFKQKGKVIQQVIETSKEFKPLAEILNP
ncbi:MAG: peptidase E [Bacteroidota bacterium]